MANNLGVSLDKLQETVAILREKKTTMKTMLGSITSSVKNLRSNWDSPASQDLQGIAADMEERFLELEEDVESFAKFLDAVISNYEGNEIIVDDLMVNMRSRFKTRNNG